VCDIPEYPKKPPFDTVRASFYLVAAIISIHCLVVVAGAISCLWYTEKILSDPAIVCDPKNRLSELLSAALAAALAFAGGLTRRDK